MKKPLTVLFSLMTFSSATIAAYLTPPKRTIDLRHVINYLETSKDNPDLILSSINESKGLKTTNQAFKSKVKDFGLTKYPSSFTDYVMISKDNVVKQVIITNVHIDCKTGNELSHQETFNNNGVLIKTLTLSGKKTNLYSSEKSAICKKL
ncbi:hypothetical protein MJ004_06465 [Acinetobacter junii]|uniref:hypothetical protein n=1 Tax=Acinetobacter junii TaxID=40215 RepID=UPI0022EB8FEE|nr:hypothetical protein [Acinetobacter junii]MDA3508246.1 hypothetical protein [Acinetobacter junii]MDA3532388.1 hypothetical protein [Acinetobacter junii]